MQTIPLTSATLCDRFRLKIKRSKWAVLVITFSVVLVCAQLCRFPTSFPFPFNSAGYAIRSFWGAYAPSYEHFSFGFGLPLGFACVVWFVLYVIFPLSHKHIKHKCKFWKFTRNFLINPSARRDRVGMLALPVIYPIFRSWEWELCQAYTKHICLGGNGDGTIQYNQIAVDHAGIIFFLIAICQFMRYHRLTFLSIRSARKSE